MNLSDLQKKLTTEERRTLTELQRNLQRQFEEGGLVTYLGELFDVLPGVFPPRPDSIGLVQSMVIKSTDRVLDVCCGSGVIGIMASKRGAWRVTGLDINPTAVSCAEQNAVKHGLRHYVYEPRESDVLSAVTDDELFDVVVFNPPYRDIPTNSMVERTMWDENLEVHRKFFEGIGQHLMPGGRIYFAQANFGDLDRVQQLLEENRWRAELINVRSLEAIPGMEFYTFEVFSCSR